MDFMWRQYPLNSSFLDPIFISKGAEIEIKCLNTLFPKWVMLQLWVGGGWSQPRGFCQFTVVYPAGPEFQPGLHLQWSNPLIGSLCGDLVGTFPRQVRYASPSLVASDRIGPLSFWFGSFLHAQWHVYPPLWGNPSQSFTQKPALVPTCF